MPLSFRTLSCVSVAIGFVDEKNSRSECSGRGVGVSKISVSTIEPFDDPKETLWKKVRKIRYKAKLGYHDIKLNKLRRQSFYIIENESFHVGSASKICNHQLCHQLWVTSSWSQQNAFEHANHANDFEHEMIMNCIIWNLHLLKLVLKNEFAKFLLFPKRSAENM